MNSSPRRNRGVGRLLRALGRRGAAPARAEIAFHHRSFVAVGETASTFRAFFVLGGRLHSVHRAFRLNPADGHLSSSRYASSLVLTRYEDSATGLRAVSTRDLGNGEDPRVVSDGARAFVVSVAIGFTPGPTPRYRVISLPDGTEYEVENVPGAALGKNWQPFIRDCALHVVHGFAPFRVLRLSAEKGAEGVAIHPTGLDISAAGQPFTMFRGGANAVAAPGGGLVGFGHITRAPGAHLPFRWRASPGGEVEARIAPDFRALTRLGYNIVDPTCLFGWRGDAWLGLSLSERDWFHGQRFADLLIRLPGLSPHEVFNLDSPIAPKLPSEMASSVVATVLPADCRADIPVKDENGRRRIAAEGWALHARGVRLTRAGRRAVRAELEYSAAGPTARMEARGLHGKVCAAIDLPATDGVVRVASLPMDAARDLKRAEIRVWNAGARLALLNLRIVFDEQEEGPA